MLPEIVFSSIGSRYMNSKLLQLWPIVAAFYLTGSCFADQPNVVVFLTDDQGWGDLSFTGNKNLATPNIDSIAHDGASLKWFYVCQVCAPTRAEFLTGRYYPKTGVSGVSRGEGRLNADETTIANIFKSAGYQTGAFGKWHNGTQPPYHPNNRGFDEFYGFTSGHWGHYFSPPLDHNQQKVRGNGFVIDDFTDHAIKFIEANKDTPFFCYLPYNTPHSPMMVPDRFYEKFEGADPLMKHRDEAKEDLMMTRAALAMCENIDWNVGRVLSKLKELDLQNETIVVYFSDNGPNSFRWNGDMKGKKGAIDEGGLRSPCFIRWPGTIAAGTVIPQIAGAIDLLPTLADLAGLEPQTNKPIDGQSLGPLLQKQQMDWPARNLLSIKAKQVSVRSQRFRLDSSGRLFDIPNDAGQRKNVADQFPEVTKSLSQIAAKHRLSMSQHFAANKDRPFTVGYGHSTTLTARDGIPHGTIQRSSKAPNNSFFKNWTSQVDAVTWDIDTGMAGNYNVTIFYTCDKKNVGCEMSLSIASGEKTSAVVSESFDPPVYDKSKERVAESHYFVKDFKPLSLGKIHLPAGRNTLTLSATQIVGEQAIDLHSIQLVQAK